MLNSEYLIQLADTCDKLGFEKLADDIDGMIRSNGFNKISQYVGAVGYAISLSRSISNCQRIKATQSSRPRQEIVMDCLKEFQDQKYGDDTWISKYASYDERRYVDGMFRQAIRAGIDPTTAANKFIKKLSEQNDLKEDIEKINSLWTRVKEASLDEDERFENLGQLAKKVAQLGGWQGVKNLWQKWRGRKDVGGSGNRQVVALLDELQTSLQYAIRDANEVLPQVKQLSTLFGIQPDTDYVAFSEKVNQLANPVDPSRISPSGILRPASRWRYNFQKEAANIYDWSQGRSSGGQYGKRELIPAPSAETRTTGGKPAYNIEATVPKPATAADPAAATGAQVAPRQFTQADQELAKPVQKSIKAITRYLANMNRIFAKLQTFPVITSDSDTMEKVQSAFNLFSKMYSGNVSPFDVGLLQSVAKGIGDTQNYLASSQKQTMPAGAETAKTPKGVAETVPEGAEKPISAMPPTAGKDLYGQFFDKLPTLSTEILSQIPKIVQQFQQYIGTTPELDSILQAVNTKLKEATGTAPVPIETPIVPVPAAPKK